MMRTFFWPLASEVFARSSWPSHHVDRSQQLLDGLRAHAARKAFLPNFSMAFAVFFFIEDLLRGESGVMPGSMTT
jgi:hypothetical protein